jgi:hypothetical protein
MAMRTITPASIAGWSAAVKRSQAWTKSTGPVTPAGRAKVSQNSVKAGLTGAAFKWAVCYLNVANQKLSK